jgi:hypothetical protein
VKTFLKRVSAFREQAGTFHELHRIVTDSVEREGVDGISDKELQVGSQVEMFLGFMGTIHALNVTGADLAEKLEATARQIDMTELFREVQVVYFYLPHTLGSVEAPNILRLAMSMLITAAEAGPAGERNRVVLCFDEAQKLVSRNMSTVFAQVWSLGTPLVLAHQYYGQLKDIFSVDMTQNLDVNCVTAIDLGAPNLFAMRRIEELSPPATRSSPDSSRSRASATPGTVASSRRRVPQGPPSPSRSTS